MFNNPKTDSKIRFQQRSFKNRLNQARGYKRPVLGNRPGEENAVLKVLRLGSPWLKISIALGLALLIYLIYIPNFLYIKKIELTGLNSQATQEAKLLLAQYLAGSRIWPQNNILLLSKKDLSSFLLAQDKNILKVDAINKHLPSGLTLTLEPREDRYLLSTANGNFIISSDGLLTVVDTASSSKLSSLTQIKFDGPDTLQTDSPYSNQAQLQTIAFLQTQLPEKINNTINYFDIRDTQQHDITVFTVSGYHILFADNNNLPDTINKLHLLLTSIAPQDLKRLYYVDMRTNNRGYVCLKGTPCASANQPVIPTTATSTASSTLQNLP